VGIREASAVDLIVDHRTVVIVEGARSS